MTLLPIRFASGTVRLRGWEVVVGYRKNFRNLPELESSTDMPTIAPSIRAEAEFKGFQGLQNLPE
jgi:hypothetical protein